MEWQMSGGDAPAQPPNTQRGPPSELEEIQEDLQEDEGERRDENKDNEKTKKEKQHSQA
jgi:hypothetical protein